MCDQKIIFLLYFFNKKTIIKSYKPVFNILKYNDRTILTYFCILGG
jgi:hypothetical protein